MHKLSTVKSSKGFCACKTSIRVDSDSQTSRYTIKTVTKLNVKQLDWDS